MSMTIGTASAVNVVLRYLLDGDRIEALGGVPTTPELKAAAKTLAKAAHKSLMAGVDQDDVEICWAVADQIARCMRCGCTDMRACADGCYWVSVDYTLGAGVCSACAKPEELAQVENNAARRAGFKFSGSK